MPFQLIITLPNRIHYCYQMTVAYIYISSGCLCNMTHKMLRMFICVLKQNPYANRVFFFLEYLKCLFFISCICYVMLYFFSLCLSVRRLTFVLTELFTKNKWFIWQIFSPHDKRFQSQPSSTRRLFCRFVFCHVIFFYSLLSFWMCDYKLWAPYIVGFYRYNDNNSHEFWHGRHFWWRLQGLLFCIS